MKYLNRSRLLLVVRCGLLCRSRACGGCDWNGCCWLWRLRHEGSRSLRIRRAHCRRLHVLHVVGHVLGIHVLHPHALLLLLTSHLYLLTRRGWGHPRNVLLHSRRPRGQIVSWITCGSHGRCWRALVIDIRRRGRRRRCLRGPPPQSLCCFRHRGLREGRLPAHQVHRVARNLVI